MKTLPIGLLAIAMATPALAGSAAPAAPPPAAKPDLDKPLTGITLRKIERLLAAAQAQGQAQCAASGVQADMQDLVKQATP